MPNLPILIFSLQIALNEGQLLFVDFHTCYMLLFGFNFLLIDSDNSAVCFQNFDRTF